MTDATTATLTVRRTNQRFAVFRKLRVLVDGAERLTLRRGEEVSVSVEPGEHDVQTAMDWCRSNILRVRCGAGQTVAIECGSQPMPWAAFNSMIAPDRVLRVSQVPERHGGAT